MLVAGSTWLITPYMSTQIYNMGVIYGFALLPVTLNMSMKIVDLMQHLISFTHLVKSKESLYKGEAYSKQKEGKKLVGDWMDAAPHLEQRNVSVLFLFVFLLCIYSIYSTLF